MKDIIIVGGGVGGLELATQLGQKLGKKEEAHITLVDKNLSHIWKPLLHEVATGVLDDDIDDVNYLVQGKRNDFSFKQGELLDIDRENKNITISEVKTATGEIIFPQSRLSYDVLIIAIGSQCNDFATPGVKENCIFLDDYKHAKYFKEKMLNRLFRISSNTDNTTRKIDVAIVGGGATGVELASELPPMVKKLASYGFDISPESLNITVIEAADRILPVLPEKLSTSIHKKLEESNITILTNTMINRADSSAFYTKDNEIINADIMVWAAGVKAPDFLKNITGLETNRANQLITELTLQTTKDKSIFALGDCAACPNSDNKTVPPTAQAAHQMTKVCAHNVMAYLYQTPMRHFKYKYKGTIISLGHTAQGNVVMGKMAIIVKGKPAYFIYRLLYRFHQFVLYGMLKTCRLVIACRLFRSLRPSLKLD